MKKLVLIKEKELNIKIENSIYCDFCGERDVVVITSGYDDEMQICFDCIKQLSKLPVVNKQ